MDAFDVIMYGTYALMAVGMFVLWIYAKKWDKEAAEREKEKLSKMSPEERSLYLARKELAEERYAALEAERRERELAEEQAARERDSRYRKAAQDYWRAEQLLDGPGKDQAKAEAMARMIANGGK